MQALQSAGGDGSAASGSTRLSLFASSPLQGGPEPFDRWRQEALIARVFEVRADPAAFESRISYRGVGTVVAMEYALSAASYRRTAERARSDGIDHVWVQLIETGGLSAQSGGLEVSLRPGFGGLCDFSVATEQASFASTGRALLIPRSAFDREARALHGLAITGGSYALLNDYIAWLCTTPGAPRVDGMERTAESIAAVVAACAGLRGVSRAEIALSLGPIALRRASAFICANMARTDLSVGEIARAAGVSRATLYRLCSSFGGVAEFVWSLRLDAARRALSDPCRPGRISAIAEEHGFTSAPLFSRRFRQTYGFSPRNLRPF